MKTETKEFIASALRSIKSECQNMCVNLRHEFLTTISPHVESFIKDKISEETECRMQMDIRLANLELKLKDRVDLTGIVEGNQVLTNRIVCAANRYPDGTILLGARHWDLHMHAQANKLKDLGWLRPKHGDCEQGFIDRMGVFKTREEALVIAKEARQIIRRCGGDENELFSENLY